MSKKSDLEYKNLQLHPDIVNLTIYSVLTKFFELFVTDDEPLENIQEQTQLYRTAQSINNSNIRNMDEITIEDINCDWNSLYMGNSNLRNRCMFWQNRTRVDVIANSIPSNRFNKILSVLHFNDNNLIPRNNTCYKIEPLIDYTRKQFQEVVIPGTCLAVDE